MVSRAIRRRPAMSAALAVLLLGVLALAATRHTQPLPLPRGQAIAVAVKNLRAHSATRRIRWDRVEVDAVDNQLERVAFFDAHQEVLEVAVTRAGRVKQAVDFKRLAVPYGDWIAYNPALLVLLAALFVLVTAVGPWRRMRNLDVGAALTLLAPVVLLQHRYVGASVLAAVPGLGYFLARSAVRALGPDPRTQDSVPLIDIITPRWSPEQRVRLLRLLLIASVVAFVMITVSSIDPVDVVYAVMEGATKLLGGALPYGHMPGDVIHGDTYPLLSYALYAPLAWLAPVHSVWDSVDLALGATVAAAGFVAWLLFRVSAGSRGSGPWRRSAAREAAGLRASLAWMAFPPILVIASSGTSDVVLAAMVVMALVLWHRPGLCAGCLAAAAWFKLAPAALIPLRLATLRGRPLVRALAAIGLITAPLLALLLALGGLAGPMTMLHAVAFQFSRGTPQSLWSALGIGTLQPLGEAGVLALICGAAVRLRARPDWAEDRVRMAALSAAVLIGLQLVANYWAFLYFAWIVPLLTISVLSEPAGIAVPKARALIARPPALAPVGATA